MPTADATGAVAAMIRGAAGLGLGRGWLLGWGWGLGRVFTIIITYVIIREVSLA